MNNNTTNKKKLELKKTAIANLSLSEAQMRMVVGGAITPDTSLIPTFSDNLDPDGCTSKPPVNKKTI